MLTRSARLGLLSPLDMACRRFDARGEMEMCIGLPESSLRGLRIGCAGRAAEGSEAVASVRRGVRCIEACCDALIRTGDV